MSKYRNISTHRNGIRFDSIFESRVYETLQGIFGNTDFIVSCQYPVVLALKNQKFPQTCWKVDFAILGNNGSIQCLVEAKAAATITEAFKVKMRWLASANMALYDKTLFVFPSHDFGGWDSHSNKCLSIDLLKEYLNGVFK